MEFYCPLIKETCKAEACIAWENNQCLMIALLKLLIEQKSSIEQL